MPIFKEDEVVALKCKNGIICLSCGEKGDFCDACTIPGDSEKEIITIHDIKNDEIIFCDNCKRIIYKG